MSDMTIWQRFTNAAFHRAKTGTWRSRIGWWMFGRFCKRNGMTATQLKYLLESNGADMSAIDDE